MAGRCQFNGFHVGLGSFDQLLANSLRLARACQPTSERLSSLRANDETPSRPFFVMKILRLVLFALCFGVAASATPADTTRQFLRALYGDPEVDLAKICHPHDDLWMLPGAKHEVGLAAVDAEEIRIGETGVFTALINQDLCVVELRDGKVDAAFNLRTTAFVQWRTVLQFLHACLLQDRDQLAHLTTHPGNVSFGKAPATAPGDMDVYEELLGLLPVVRSSNPVDDAKSRSVTYRVPIGPQGYAIRLIRDGSAWKIDTSKKTAVPMEFFYR